MNEDQTGGTGITGHYTVDEPMRNHAEGFSRALENALEEAEKQGVIKRGGQYESEVRYSVGIEFTNPPWVGDYRVWLDPQPRP